MAKKKEELEIIEKEHVMMPIVDELKRNFVLYAKDINKNRAFPHLLPGIKPIAGHALWSMWINGRRANKPYTKSAKVEGEVMSYSPHGGSYDSLVRLAQDFTYHVPYIDGHGSFGSVVGGPTPGAARYTEIRLSEFIQDVLFYNTKLLDMGMNYLDEEPEPILEKWVALLPLLFMTNTSGMGYTVSNTWSSGNLFEFREQLINYLENGKVDCSKVYPDFPTGGIIINKKEMKNLYETGSGTIRLRGNTEIDGNTIKILSLPYQTYPEQFMEDIKKYITTDNKNTITNVANRCGNNGFLIEIECEDNTAEYTLDMLFRRTCLQTTISDDHKAVTDKGKPELITFLDYMKEFVESNIELVKKEAKLNLDEIIDRLELVDGLLNALDIIDEIIKEIKKSKSMDDAKTAIMNMKKYNFTERQADYIVHTPLGRLANLENVKLQDEKKELEKRKAENEKLLSSRKAQEKYFLNRFNKLVDKYGWERKTQLTDIDIVAEKKEATKNIVKTKKEFMVIITNSNTIKRTLLSNYKHINSGIEKELASVKVQTGGKVNLISNKGNHFKLSINKIKVGLSNSMGANLRDLLNLESDEVIIGIYNKDVNTLPYIVFITEQGFVKKIKADTILKIGKTAATKVMKLNDEDKIIYCDVVKEKDSLDVITNKKTHTIDTNTIKDKGRGAGGNRVVKLKKDEKIESIK